MGDDWSHKSTDSVSTFSHPLHSLSILGDGEGHYPRASNIRCGQLQCFCQFLRFCSGKKGEISVGRTVPAGRRASCGKGRNERATGGEYIVYVKWINKWCQAVYSICTYAIPYRALFLWVVFGKYTNRREILFLLCKQKSAVGTDFHSALMVICFGRRENVPFKCLFLERLCRVKPGAHKSGCGRW